MAVSPSSLVLRFPTFSDVPLSLVDQCIQEAESRTDAAVWGARTDQGVQWLAAHLIAMSPEYTQTGGKCKCGADGLTSYMRERVRMSRVVAGGFKAAFCP